MQRLVYVPITLAWALLPAAQAWGATAPAAGVAATEAAAPADADADTKGSTAAVGKREIVVTSSPKIKGQVEVPQAPVATFSEEDIAAYGVSSVSDLIDAISPQTGTGRGRGSSGPVILVNGQRIASFRELRDYPPEAIKKVEVLPEEVALKYGYSADQRVVNIILKDKYSTRVGEVEYEQPDIGGYSTVKTQAGLLDINKGKRLNVNLRWQRTSALTESERDLVPANTVQAGDPNPAAARTLVANSTQSIANITYTVPLGKPTAVGPGSGNITLNTTFTHNEADAMSGLSAVTLTSPSGATAYRTLGDPLHKRTHTDTAQGGVGINKPVLLNWNLSATVDATHTESKVTSDTALGTSALSAGALAGNFAITGALPMNLVTAGSQNVSRTNTDTASAAATLMGSPLRLPAGKVNSTLNAGFSYSGLNSSSTLGSSTNLKRSDATAGLNVSIPLTSRKEHIAEFLGDITLNLSAGGDYLSDAGWLRNSTAGLTWSVTPKLQLQGSYIYSEAAPSLSNLGSPVTYTYNVAVYDYATGKSALVTSVSGGNPALRNEHRNDYKLGLNYTLPLSKLQGNLIVEYFNNRSNDVSASFPSALTSTIEAAFPGRVTRNAAGTIVQIDARAITLAEQSQSRVRWGINLGGNMGKPVAQQGRFGFGGPPPGGPGGGPGGPGGGMGGGMGGPGGGGGPGGPGGGGGPGGPPGGPGGQRYEGRWNVSIYHTVQLSDHVLIAQGTQVLDELAGNTLSSGVARHSLEMEGGSFYQGAGLRLNGSWSAPSHVNGNASGTSALRFGALFKLNARLFVDLGQQKTAVAQIPFFKNARFSIYANNVFDQRQLVTDSTGATPQAYQKPYRDAAGRVIGLELRKLF